ncbi:MAG: hypothetical protein R3Y15_00430 [Rikenellaceae bacterium]
MKKILFIFVAIFIATSCVREDQFNFESIDKIGFSNVSLVGANIDSELTISNQSRKRLTIKQVELNISKGERTIARAKLQEPVVVNKRSQESVEATIRLTTSPGIGAFALMGLANDIDQLTVEGFATIKLGAINRKIEIPPTPVKNLANALGLQR